MEKIIQGLTIKDLRAKYPDKFLSSEAIFGHINRGDKIFIGTGCGEPQFLVNSLIEYVRSHPKAFFDAEVLHVWTLGVAPYADAKFKHNFRHNSFFIGNSSRDAVNAGIADYTPIFLSEVPGLFRKNAIEVDIALIQTSSADHHGYMSLGVSVDIVKAACDKAKIVIAQINKQMPRIHGDGFIHINDVDFIIAHDEPLLEFAPEAEDNQVAEKIGNYVSRLIMDGV